MKRPLLILALFCLLVTPVAAQSTGIVVDAGEVLHEISPYVYGANYGPLSFVPIDLYPEAEASGVTYVRFPGGRWGDQNNLQGFQIDMFITLVRMMGAEPAISVRLEGGTPEQAADLVRYANIENDYNVQFWSIGNEPNLFDDYTAEDLNREWRPIAEAMLEADPDITLIGPDLSQWAGIPSVDPVDPEGRDWLREFLLANGDMVDVVAIHRYPFPQNMANPVTSIEAMRQNAAQWSEIIPNMRAVIEETTGRTDLPVAIMEASSHWSNNMRGETTPDSHFHAIWWADALGRLIEHDPFAVAYYELQTPVDRGVWGMLGRYEVRPTYYVYQLYQQFGEQLVRAETDTEYLSAFAALREDGALTLIITNLNDEAQAQPLTLENFTPGGAAEVWRFDEENAAVQLDDLDLADGDTLTVPGQSVTLYIIPAA
jgi:hypothetical protein